MTPASPSWPLACIALGLAACDLGLDPSMVGGAGGGTTSATTTTSSTGTSATTTTTATTTSTGAGGAGGDGGAGAGGAAATSTASSSASTGAGGGILWEPCAPPEDFESPFSLGDPNDNWFSTGQVSTVNQGDVVLRLEANAADATFERDVDATLTGCFLSARVEEASNDEVYLLVDCEPGVVQFLLGFDTKSLSVDVTAPPAPTPEPSPVNLATEPDVPAVMRVRFEGPDGQIVFELKEQGDADFTPHITMPQPDWMTDCRVGLGTTSNTVVRVDDVCLDPP